MHEGLHRALQPARQVDGQRPHLAGGATLQGPKFVDFRRKGPFDKPMLLGVLAYTRDFMAKWPKAVDGVFYIEEMVPAAWMGADRAA